MQTNYFSNPKEAIYKLNIKEKFCLFESTEITEEDGKLSLLGFDPPLELKGKNNICEVIIHKKDRAEKYLNCIEKFFSEFIIQKDENKWTLKIDKIEYLSSENNRINRQNIAQIIRTLLKELKSENQAFLGLYGAFSYYFVCLFEDIIREKESQTDDFHLFLFDTILTFNHVTKTNEVFIHHNDYKIEDILNNSINDSSKENQTETEISDLEFFPCEEDFKNQVQQVIDNCKIGEFMEVVLARKIKANFKGNPMELYENYKAINPSPYLFYFDLNDEIILGASPEIMVKCQNRKVTLKPISGTIQRGKDTLEDHINMMYLLNSPKEKAELDMLIDLGRNDLSRICKPGITIEQYRSIEKYSHVYHTVAKVSGFLEDEYSGFDALINCLNAGTLTGAPKIAAMNFIEKTESHQRGYYGGCVGYLTFDDQVNTAITIRTVYIKQNHFEYLTGATILYESNPDGELQETKNKAAAFMQSIKKFIK